MAAFLRPDGFAGPRGLRALSREGSAMAEVARLVRHTRAERRVDDRRPYAGPHTRAAVDPVLLVPGFMAGDATLRAMSAFLRRHGYRTYRSAIHVNVGCTREAADRLERRLEALAQRRGRPVSIVGHSLGGMLARALAARRPDLVAGIVTLGSPVLAPGAVHQVLAWDLDLLVRLARAGITGLMSEDCVAGDCARTAHVESQAPLPDGFGFTAVYSRRDGIVDWRACLDPAARHVEVPTSHCGMAVDPVVLEAVRHALDEQRAARVAPSGRATAAPISLPRAVRASAAAAPRGSVAVPRAARR